MFSTNSKKKPKRKQLNLTKADADAELKNYNQKATTLSGNYNKNSKLDVTTADRTTKKFSILIYNNFYKIFVS